jgi:hypothetical protein
MIMKVQDTLEFSTRMQVLLQFLGYALVSPTAPGEQYRQRHREQPVWPHGNNDITKGLSWPVWLRHYDSMEQQCVWPALVRP